MSAKTITVELVKSISGRVKSHRACVAGLGLSRLHQRVNVIDTPENRGMISKVSYLLKTTDA